MAKPKSSYFAFLGVQDKLKSNLDDWCKKLYDSANEIIINEQIDGLSPAEKNILLEEFSKEDDTEWQKTSVNTKFYTRNAYRELLIKKIKE